MRDSKKSTRKPTKEEEKNSHLLIQKLHLTRLQSKSEGTNVELIGKYLSQIQDSPSLLDQLDNFESDFYQQFNIAESVLKSEFDFVRITKNARNINHVQDITLSKFQQAFKNTFRIIQKGLQEEGNPIFKGLRDTIEILLHLSSKQQLQYWQNEAFDAIYLTALKESFLCIAGSNDLNRTLDIMFFFRPTIIRDMYGVDAHIKDVEGIADLLDQIFEIPSIYSLSTYDNIIDEFGQQGLKEEEIKAKLKEEFMEVLRIDATEDTQIHNLLISVAKKVQKNPQKYWTSAVELTETPGKVAEALRRNLAPYAKNFNSANKLKSKIQSDWNKSILPKLINFLQKRQNITKEQTELITNLFTKIHQHIKPTLNNVFNQSENTKVNV